MSILFKMEFMQLHSILMKMIEYAKVLSKERKTADYFEEVISYGSDIELTVNFLTSAILSTLNKLDISIKELFRPHDSFEFSKHALNVLPVTF